MPGPSSAKMSRGAAAGSLLERQLGKFQADNASRYMMSQEMLEDNPLLDMDEPMEPSVQDDLAGYLVELVSTAGDEECINAIVSSVGIPADNEHLFRNIEAIAKATNHKKFVVAESFKNMCNKARLDLRALQHLIATFLYHDVHYSISGTSFVTAMFKPTGSNTLVAYLPRYTQDISLIKAILHSGLLRSITGMQHNRGMITDQDFHRLIRLCTFDNVLDKALLRSITAMQTGRGMIKDDDFHRLIRLCTFDNVLDKQLLSSITGMQKSRGMISDNDFHKLRDLCTFDGILYTRLLTLITGMQTGKGMIPERDCIRLRALFDGVENARKITISLRLLSIANKQSLRQSIDKLNGLLEDYKSKNPDDQNPSIIKVVLHSIPAQYLMGFCTKWQRSKRRFVELNKDRASDSGQSNIASDTVGADVQSGSFDVSAQSNELSMPGDHLSNDQTSAPLDSDLPSSAFAAEDLESLEKIVTDFIQGEGSGIDLDLLLDTDCTADDVSLLLGCEDDAPGRSGIGNIDIDNLPATGSSTGLLTPTLAPKRIQSPFSGGLGLPW